MDLRERCRGMLYGLAIGDALGAAVEFMEPGEFPEVTGFRAGGPHGLKAGEWTDDTSMALALADSIAVAGWDLNDQARRYVRWWQQGDYAVNGRCFDIGLTTQRSLANFAQTGAARTCASRSDDSAGNGSIMRLAPVPIHFAHLFPDRLDDLARHAAESSLVTHGSSPCQSACIYLATVLCGLAHGQPREEVLAADWDMLKRLGTIAPLHASIAKVAAGSFRDPTGKSIRGSGYVVKSLEAALWAFHDAVDFRQAVLRAVNLGDDADSTGAVCGQLAGACWGEAGIPPEWRAGLARRDMIENALAGVLPRPPNA
jgi:ADP-ribosylglycohydrolase